MSGMRRTLRNSVKDRPAGWRLLLRRQRGLVKPGAWIVAVVGVLALLTLAARSVVPGLASGHSVSSLRERFGLATAASGLRVTDVVIEGRANTPEPLLHAAIGVSRGDPILGFSLDQARARIETLSWVDHATVERRLPGTVVVYLQERRPFAVWQNQGKYQLVDRAGQVVADQDVAQFRQLPLIVGQGAPAAAAPLLDALTDRPSLAAKVAASVRVGGRRWNLLTTSGSDVMLPEGHEVAAIARLLQLQQDHAVLDRPLVAIDLRLPDRLVLRPRPDSDEVSVTPPLPPSALPLTGSAPAALGPVPGRPLPAGPAGSASAQTAPVRAASVRAAPVRAAPARAAPVGIPPIFFTTPTVSVVAKKPT